MKGEWVMFRLKPKPGEKAEKWMLKKVADDFAKPEEGDALVEECVTSVKTGRTMDEIAAGSRRLAIATAAARRAAGPSARPAIGPPKFREPQLATLVDDVPAGSGWLHEINMTAIAAARDRPAARRRSSPATGLDWTDKFRGIVEAAADLPAGCLLDGEIVALDDKGKPDFSALQASAQGRQADLAFFVFDVLVDRRRGHRASCPTSSARSGSRRCSGGQPPDPLCRPYHRQGRGLFEAMCEAGGEGIISQEGRRRPIAARRTPQLAQDQMHPPPGIRHRRLAGERQEAAASARCCLASTRAASCAMPARSAPASTTKLIEEPAARRMRPLEVDKPPLDVPRAEARGAHWVKPELVAEIAFAEFTADGIVRHASFLGLRERQEGDGGGRAKCRSI